MDANDVICDFKAEVSGYKREPLSPTLLQRLHPLIASYIRRLVGLGMTADSAQRLLVNTLTASRAAHLTSSTLDRLVEPTLI